MPTDASNFLVSPGERIHRLCNKEQNEQNAREIFKNLAQRIVLVNI
jgi:hypothetical protein